MPCKYQVHWKIKSCHDANFVVTGGGTGTTSDDKVGIMKTICFHWSHKSFKNFVHVEQLVVILLRDCKRYWFNNGLLPDCTKPFPSPILPCQEVRFNNIHLRAISREMCQPPIIECSLKITYLKFYSNLPGAWDYCAESSLTHWGGDKMAAIFQMTFSNVFSSNSNSKMNENV